MHSSVVVHCTPYLLCRWLSGQLALPNTAWTSRLPLARRLAQRQQVATVFAHASPAPSLHATLQGLGRTNSSGRQSMKAHAGSDTFGLAASSDTSQGLAGRTSQPGQAGAHAPPTKPRVTSRPERWGALPVEGVCPLIGECNLVVSVRGTSALWLMRATVCVA